MPGPPDVLIVGAGLAGSAAACLLTQRGGTVRLLDRERAPHHKVCGEFLSIEAARHLHDLGLDLQAMGASSIDRVRLVSGKIEAEAPLPFGAVGLSRYALDEALLDRAVAAGAQVERGVRVLELDGGRVRTSQGDRQASHVLLATGKLPVRERRSPPAGRVAGGYVGFKMHYRLAPPASRRLAGMILLVLFKGGYAGLQMVEGGRANLCLVLRREHLASLGGDWSSVRRLLDETPCLRDLLADAEALFDRPVTIANLAYGIPNRTAGDPRVLRLGDQWGMTASLTGDGMAIALRSAFLAARSLAGGEDGAAYHRHLDAEVRPQVVRAMALQKMLDVPLVQMTGCRLAGFFPSLLSYAARVTRLRDWDALRCRIP